MGEDHDSATYTVLTCTVAHISYFPLSYCTFQASVRTVTHLDHVDSYIYSTDTPVRTQNKQ